MKAFNLILAVVIVLLWTVILCAGPPVAFEPPAAVLDYADGVALARKESKPLVTFVDRQPEDIDGVVVCRTEPLGELKSGGIYLSWPATGSSGVALDDDQPLSLQVRLARQQAQPSPLSFRVGFTAGAASLPGRPYADPPGTHRHKCAWCGTVWSHGSNSAGNEKAHTCPSCGKGPSWNQYNGWQGPTTTKKTSALLPMFCPT